MSRWVTERRHDIYAIINTVNNRVYVGKTRKAKTRWDQHRGQLRRGAHPNPTLQADWQKYGEQAFSFVVLETMSCPIDDRVDGDVKRDQVEFVDLHARQREQHWMDYFSDKLYNAAPAVPSEQDLVIVSFGKEAKALGVSASAPEQQRKQQKK